MAPLPACPHSHLCRIVTRLSLALLPALLAILGASPGTADDEKVLVQAGIGNSDAELLDFFRARTLTEERRRQIPGLVQQLGDGALKVRTNAARDLIALGRPAAPALQAALTDPNDAIGTRAKQCLALIDEEAQQTAAALRLLVDRKPIGASAVLLAYLPGAGDETLEEGTCDALAILGVRDGQPEPALLAAVQSSVPVQRMAAVAALARTGPRHRATARQLLEDPEPRVRWYTARLLLRERDKPAVPTLVALTGDGPLDLARQADELLCQIAGSQPPPAGLGTGAPASRQRCRASWTAWWQANEAQTDLAALNFQVDANAERTQLVNQAIGIVREALKRQPPDSKDREKARIAAGMIAVYAQSGPRGAATPLRATLRDAGLQLAHTIQTERFDEASKQAAALASLNPDPGAVLGAVRLDKHLGVLDVMAQFRPERTGGLGIETKLLNLETAAKKERELPAATLDHDLALKAAHVARSADVLKEFTPRKAPQAWQQHSEEMRQAALALGGASKAKDGKAAWTALQRLNQSCASCHESFR